ncbi:MAG: type II secretion system protein GspG [Kiritimatiellales bacterium]|nr:type II secretion system protein GspG [Kiritimatiellales bacterium]
MENKKRNQHLSKRSGFTLIEIILVVVIIGILAGIAIPRMGGKTEKAQISQAKSNIAALSMAIQEFEMMNGSYPSSLEELLDESKGGPYMEKKVIPTDPWGVPFVYAAPGSHNSHTFDLSCTAGKSGTVINNWE